MWVYLTRDFNGRVNSHCHPPESPPIGNTCFYSDDTALDVDLRFSQLDNDIPRGSIAKAFRRVFGHGVYFHGVAILMTIHHDEKGWALEEDTLRYMRLFFPDITYCDCCGQRTYK